MFRVFFPVESPLLVTHQFPHLLMHTLSAAVISVIHLLAILGCFHDRLLVWLSATAARCLPPGCNLCISCNDSLFPLCMSSSCATTQYDNSTYERLKTSWLLSFFWLVNVFMLWCQNNNHKSHKVCWQILAAETLWHSAASEKVPWVTWAGPWRVPPVFRGGPCHPSPRTTAVYTSDSSVS